VSYYNEADRLISESVPTIPLFQKPTFLAYQSYVKGMTDNVLSAGPMWNAQDWWLAK
jgi:peptide/nickel transport system substrate-binding protein